MKRKEKFRPGDRVYDLWPDGEPRNFGFVVKSLADDLTFVPNSYECDLGHGYIVVRHASELRHDTPRKGKR